MEVRQAAPVGADFAPTRGSGRPGVPDEVRQLERTSDYVISTWRRVLFLGWRGPETVAGILRSRSLMEPWAADKQEGVLLAILMPPKGALHGPPSAETRRAMANASRDAPPAFKGIAIIGSDQGFIGSVIRSVMTAQHMFVRSSVPFKMFSSAAEAAPWIARRLELQTDLRSDFAAAAENATWK